jgi:hypothetical protein
VCAFSVSCSGSRQPGSAAAPKIATGNRQGDPLRLLDLLQLPTPVISFKLLDADLFCRASRRAA